MTDLEADVPEKIEDLPEDLLDIRGDLAATIVQKHEVDIAVRIQFAAAVTAERDQAQRRRGRAFVFGKVRCRRKDMLEQHIDQFAAPSANIPAAAAGVVLEAEAMFFNA